jgi:hypothetical protein
MVPRERHRINPSITPWEIQVIQERCYELARINPYITADDIRRIQERLYESMADSFDVPPAAIDINHCSLEEWAARVDTLVREVI